MSFIGRYWHRCIVRGSLFLSATIAVSTLSPLPFSLRPLPVQAQVSHPFAGNPVVYVQSGDRWREAMIVRVNGRSSDGQDVTWVYTVEYLDDQGGRESAISPNRLRTIATAQAQGLTETVYDLTTQAGIDQMLEAHNQLRREVGVPEVTWSEELAAFAQTWANVLIREGGLRHRPAAERNNGQIGENLASIYSSAPGGAVRSPRQAVRGWAEEKAHYSYDSNSCTPGEECGHYTQMIWADTTEVGCAVARNEDATEEVWVCNYNPAGNIVGQRPY